MQMNVPKKRSKLVVPVSLRPGRTRGWFVPVLVVCVLVTVAAALFLILPTLMEEISGGTRSEGVYQPGVGRQLAALALEPLTGDAEPATLESLAGKVVIVNFWGTWCPPCRVELPHLVDLGERFHQHADFRLFLVSCAAGREEDPLQLKEETEAFLADSGYRVPTYWDPGFKTRLAFHRAATLRGFPTTFVLDRQGVIRGIWNGFHPKVPEEIRDLVQQLLL